MRGDTMKNVQSNFLIAVLILSGFALSCSMFGGANSNGGSNAGKTKKGVSAISVCQVLAQPTYENKFPYDGKGCSGSTFFGAKDTRAGSYETDSRPSFSYFATGEDETITKVVLNMSKRPDGAAFFLATGNSVAKAINGQPLPKEIEDSINGPMSTLGGDVTISSKSGDARVELVRSNIDSKFRLSFEF